MEMSDSSRHISLGERHVAIWFLRRSRRFTMTWRIRDYKYASFRVIWGIFGTFEQRYCSGIDLGRLYKRNYIDVWEIHGRVTRSWRYLLPHYYVIIIRDSFQELFNLSICYKCSWYGAIMDLLIRFVNKSYGEIVSRDCEGCKP